MWACTTYTVGGQLVGLRKFEVRTRIPESTEQVMPSSPPPDAPERD
jgi:hypothetical protein